LKHLHLRADLVAVAGEHGCGDAIGDVPRQVPGTKRELALDTLPGTCGGGVDQRDVLRPVLVHHHRADSARHDDRGHDGDDYVFALETGDGHGRKGAFLFAAS
jgi:hypothetical protein